VVVVGSAGLTVEAAAVVASMKPRSAGAPLVDEDEFMFLNS